MCEMTEDRAREILAEAIQSDGSLNWDKCSSWNVVWSGNRRLITLDGLFSAEELMAIAWWMRNKAKEES